MFALSYVPITEVLLDSYNIFLLSFSLSLLGGLTSVHLFGLADGVVNIEVPDWNVIHRDFNQILPS
jgi:hypothetical protein